MQGLQFNRGPEWIWEAVSRSWGFLEQYGWYLVLGGLAAAWLLHQARPYLEDLKEARRHRGLDKEEQQRAARLEQRRREAVTAKEKEMEKAKEAWLVHRAEETERKRIDRIKELEAKERRLGIRPRGTAHKTGECEGEDDELYL